MNVAAPLGLLAAGLAVPLTIWYLLRSRRPRMPVASTFLWERAERSVAAAVPWQRFRGDVTYWLILLALLAGAFALARPFLTVPARLSDHTILVLDASASMLADEDGPTRLELARREVESLVSTMSPGQQVSVIEAGARARVLLSASSDADAVLDASRGVRISHGPANLGDAFTLAAALQRPGQATAVHLMTDGEVPAEWRGDAPPGLQVTAVGAPRPTSRSRACRPSRSARAPRRCSWRCATSASRSRRPTSPSWSPARRSCPNASGWDPASPAIGC